jgi:4-amino-4-deoxy-L-arabinose transferase-like glycosyltransferase
MLNRFGLWAVGLLTVLWGTRLWRIEQIPLHVDEAIHIYTAFMNWEGHLFWRIRTGKLLGYWAIAAFYPQNEMVFVSRIATLFVVLIGFAAGIALIRRLFGTRAALIGGVLWVCSPYVFFLERFALMDAQIGATVVLAAWAALELTQRFRWRWAVLTGLLMPIPILYKISAAPVVGMVGLILLFAGTLSLKDRIRSLLIIGVTTALIFVPPALYVLPRSADQPWLADLGALDTQGSSVFEKFSGNLDRLWQALTGFENQVWPLLLGLGLLLLVLLRPKRGLFWVGIAALPALVVMVLGEGVFLRYFQVSMPFLLLLAGAGLAVAIERFSKGRQALTGLIVAGSLLASVPFAWSAYYDIQHIRLPLLMHEQYLSEHSAGFGLKEAMEALPTTQANPEIPVIASMFPDSCRRANLYAVSGHVLTCVNAPGLPEIEAALATQGEVYVLAESTPLIGVDVRTLDALATQIAAYPRPGESADDASVVLWHLTRSE